MLEREGRDIGLVTGIVGITRFEILVEGRPAHAGTTPMDARVDALVAASDLVLKIRERPCVSLGSRAISSRPSASSR